MEIDITQTLFPLTLVGLPILALMAIGCLLYCRGKNRMYLAWAAAVFLGALILYFGGIILLGCFGLTWRNLPTVVLLGTLLVSGWVGIALTLNCILSQRWPELAPVLRWAVKGGALLLSGAVLVTTILYGPFLMAFGFGSEERVVEYKGQTLLEVDKSWLDPDYRYYVYHGPLVRGTEQIRSGSTHIDEDIN